MSDPVKIPGCECVDPPGACSLHSAAPDYHLAAHALLTKLASLSKDPVKAWPLLTREEIQDLVAAFTEAKARAEGRS